jgi:hypothetical protein
MNRRLVVGCFYTPEYAAIFRSNLQASCERLEVPLKALALPSLKNWTANCGLKPSAAIEIRMAIEPDEWLLFLDVDAQVMTIPPIDDIPEDCLMAARWLHRWTRETPEMLSGTLVIPPGPGPMEVLNAWQIAQDAKPARWDQRNLQDVIQLFPSIQFIELSDKWCWIQDLETKVQDTAPQCPIEQAFIVHGQASRRMRDTIR